jgi:hypothetical protein|tara:strand:- start:610 stop:1464 length:855 start_codon:yes stop_codon:yes gene_type:complete
MDYVQLLYDLLPSIPPESLRDWAFVVIMIPAIARVILLSTLYKKFSEIFPSKKAKATRLLVKLRVPGLNTFVVHQSAMILLPGLISLPVLYYSGLDDIYWGDLPSQTATMATIGLVLWTTYGVYKAIELKEEVREILDKLQKLLDQLKISISGLKIHDPSSMSDMTWVLKLAVDFRKKMDSMKGWATKNTPKTVEKNIMPFFGSLGEAITTIIDQESKKITKKIQEIASSTSDIISDKFNRELDRLFYNYVGRSELEETSKVILFSALPSLWLALVAWHSGLGF